MGDIASSTIVVLLACILLTMLFMLHRMSSMCAHMRQAYESRARQSLSSTAATVDKTQSTFARKVQRG